MVIKRLTNLFLLRGRLFNLRLWFWEVFLSFLWWLLCCVMVDIPIFSSFFFSPIFILFFSIHFGVFIFFRLVRSLWEMKKDKNLFMVLQGIKGWSLSRLSSGSSLKFALLRVINFLISRNNTNSQSTEQQCDEKKENHQTRGYHLIEHHILKDIFITHVWQTVKRIDFNILEVKGLVPLRQPMVLFLPELFLNWSLLVPIDFVTWYVFTVDYPDITITDWQSMFTRDVWLCPKINMWCMNFIERQGMARFEANILNAWWKRGKNK